MREEHEQEVIEAVRKIKSCVCLRRLKKYCVQHINMCSRNTNDKTKGLHAYEMKFLRSKVGIAHRNKIRNETIREELQEQHVLGKIEEIG